MVDLTDLVKCLSRCGAGFKMTPRGCQDINECLQNPCHESAVCANTVGSFRCSCQPGTVGDPYLAPGCVSPDECRSDTDCASTLSCVQAHCTDPCVVTQCAQSAVCSVQNHQAYCSCLPGQVGDPSNPDIGCYKVECVNNNDCAPNKHCDPQNNKCTSKFCQKKECITALEYQILVNS